MLEVIICDDHPDVVRKIRGFIDGLLMQEDIRDIEISLATTNPNRVLSHIGIKNDAENLNFNKISTRNRLFFLDIHMGHTATYDGITLAKEIRKYDPFSDIVFISSHRALISDIVSSQILPLDFLTKGINLENLRDDVICLVKKSYDRMIQRSVKEDFITIKNGRTKMMLNLPDIYYIKGNEGYNGDLIDDLEAETALTLLVAGSGIYPLKKNLKYYDQEIEELIRLGRSFLVNPFNVRKIEEGSKQATLTLTNGERLTVTPKSLKEYETTFEKLKQKRLSKSSS